MAFALLGHHVAGTENQGLVCEGLEDEKHNQKSSAISLARRHIDVFAFSRALFDKPEAEPLMLKVEL